MQKTLSFVFPAEPPKTEEEFKKRENEMLWAWEAVLRTGDPDVELDCYPGIIGEAKLLYRAFPTKELGLTIDALTQALE